MIKNIKKILVIIIIMFLLNPFFDNVSLATDGPYVTDVIYIASENASQGGNATYNQKMKSLITDSETKWNDTTGASGSVNSIVSTIITIVRIVGVAVALIMLLVIAMKYMYAAPGEKADIKKSAVVYVIGAIVLFAVTGILGIIAQFAKAV